MSSNHQYIKKQNSRKSFLNNVWVEFQRHDTSIINIIFNLLLLNAYVVLKILVIPYYTIRETIKEFDDSDKIQSYENIINIETEMKMMNKRIEYLEKRNLKRLTPQKNIEENNLKPPPIPPPFPSASLTNCYRSSKKSPFKVNNNSKQNIPKISLEEIKQIKLRKIDKVSRYKTTFVSPRNFRQRSSMKHQIKSPSIKDGSAFTNARKRFMLKSPNNDLERYLKNVNGYPMYDTEK